MKKMIKKVTNGLSHFFNELVKANEINLKSKGLL